MSGAATSALPSPTEAAALTSDIGIQTRGSRHKRQLPLLPTLFVLAVLPVLIGLGVWQLQRMQWKNAMLAAMSASVDQPLLALGNQPIPANAAFRHISIRLDCPRQQPGAEAGRNRQGQTGWAFTLGCRSGRQPVKLVIGWHARPDGWQRASLPFGVQPHNGLAVPGPDGRWRLSSSTAPPPLQPVAPPTPAEIPNNHLAYAIQWFAFAGVLLTIYGVLLRRWWVASPHGNE